MHWILSQFNLKIYRIGKAIQFLRLINSDGLADTLDEHIFESPSRQWVNSIIVMIDAKLAQAKFIDGKRFLACSFETIHKYFDTISPIIKEYDKILVFTSDETMMECTKSVRNIVPRTIPTYTEEKPPEMPHITAMCTTSIIGSKPPLFIILKNKKTIPKEIKDLINSGQLWIISSPTGWMDRWCFLIWTFNFIGWCYSFRQKLASSLRSLPILLILDGHTSRECPIALQLLKIYNICVFVLPGHTTHVLQLFDIGLAGPLKTKFTIIFSRNLKDSKKYTETKMSANIRKIAIESFLEAWDLVCSKSNCEAGARAIGLHPLNRSAPLSSGFVKDLSPAERARQDAIDARKQRRLDINNCVITDDAKIEEIRATVSRSAKDCDLAKRVEDFESYHELCMFYFSEAKKRGISIHSLPHPIADFTYDEIFAAH